jgi:2-oxoisovalerate dehydrogenase E1 component
MYAAHPAFPEHLGLVIAATETADTGCPSLAGLCLLEVQRLHGTPVHAAAFDLNAACSGWLYALRIAHDHLVRQPGQLVLVVTADHLTPLLDPDDFSTRILFGDAATATIVGTRESFEAAGIAPELEVERPVLMGHPDTDGALTCPTPARQDRQRLHMNGPRVYREAVKAMGQALRAACTTSNISLSDLDLVIPHQANQRILDAVERALDLPGRVYSAIARTGNTSASSIPLAMEALITDRALDGGLPATARTGVRHQRVSRETSGRNGGETQTSPVTSVEQDAPATGGSPRTLGLVAFGGGYTYAAAVARLAD